MFNAYVDLEIRIRALDANRYALDIRGFGGDASGTLVLPTADPAYQALAARLERLDTDEEMLVQLGQMLFQAIFQGNIEKVYARTQGLLNAEQGMRLRLDIDAADRAVAGLPWEFLYDPDQGPLAMLDVPIVRYLPQQAVLPTLKTALPLKVLLTGAQPRTLEQLNVAREIEEVSAALAELGDQVQITVEQNLTPAKLQKLLRGGFQIWHFVGHGAFSRDGKTGVLQFEDPTGEAEAVSALQLGIMLNRSGVRLIVLDACNSGKLMTDPFRGVAPALIRAQTPAVVAMQFKVPDEAARAFAGEFYRALAEGFPIDACVTEGRKAIMNATGLGNPDWGIPVVYTRAPDGKLFELVPSASPLPAQASGHNTSAPSADAGASWANERAEEIETLREQIRSKRRRLNERKLQEAKMGMMADPMIKIDIEDLDREITKLERQLQALTGT